MSHLICHGEFNVTVEGNEHGAHGSVNGDLRARKTQSMEVSNDKSQLSAEANTSTDKVNCSTYLN